MDDTLRVSGQVPHSCEGLPLQHLSPRLLGHRLLTDSERHALTHPRHFLQRPHGTRRHCLVYTHPGNRGTGKSQSGAVEKHSHMLR